MKITIKSGIKTHFPCPSVHSPTQSATATLDKPINNIVPTNAFLPLSEPDDTIWLIY